LPPKAGAWPRTRYMTGAARIILIEGGTPPAADGIVAKRCSELLAALAVTGEAMRDPTMTIFTTADADDATSNMRIPGAA
jgi:hypothetical protein